MYLTTAWPPGMFYLFLAMQYSLLTSPGFPSPMNKFKDCTITLFILRHYLMLNDQLVSDIMDIHNTQLDTYTLKYIYIK